MGHRGKNAGALLLAALLALGLTACGRDEPPPVQPEAPEPSMSESSSSSQQEQPDGQGSEAPVIGPPYTLSNFISIDLDKNTVTADIFADSKMTMVFVWGVNSQPCLNVLPDIMQVAKDNRAKGVQTIGMLADVTDKDLVDTANRIVERLGIDFPQLLPTEELCSAKLYEVDTIPTVFFVDGEGNQLDKDYVGKKSPKVWGKMIDFQLQELEES